MQIEKFESKLFGNGMVVLGLATSHVRKWSRYVTKGSLRHITMERQCLRWWMTARPCIHPLLKKIPWEYWSAITPNENLAWRNCEESTQATSQRRSFHFQLKFTGTSFTSIEMVHTHIHTYRQTSRQADRQTTRQTYIHTLHALHRLHTLHWIHFHKIHSMHTIHTMYIYIHT